MNIGEANAVNTLVRAVACIPDGQGRLPTAEQQQSAIDLLLAGAHRKLSAGLRPGDVSLVGGLVANELTMAADAMEVCVEQPDEDWGRGVLFVVGNLRARVEALTGEPS